MSLTKFGNAVRAYRRQLNLTLSVMANDLSTSPAFLSSMETGRSKVPMEWADKIAEFFSKSGLRVSKQDLRAFACEANESIPLEGVPPQYRALIAGFANSDFSRAELEKFGELIAQIHKETDNNEQ